MSDRPVSSRLAPPDAPDGQATNAPPAPLAVTRGEAFWYWLRLGFISFGGPAGQIAVMHENWSSAAAGSPRTDSCTP